MINSINNSTNMNTIRFGGLASGLDTEGIVNRLMSLDKRKVDDLYGRKQIFQWQQESYRDVIDRLNSFRNQFFNTLNRENNMLSYGTRKNVSIPSTTSVEVHANSEAVNGTYVINEIVKTALAANITSSSVVKSSIRGTEDLGGILGDVNGTSLKISLDGITREITLDNNYASSVELVDALGAKIDTAFGAGRINVSLNGGMYLDLYATNSNLTVTSGTNDLLTLTGIESGASDFVDINASLSSAFGQTGDVSFKINGESFTFSDNTRLFAMMDTINSSDAGVTMNYSSINDSFTIRAKDTGASSYIEIENISGDMFGDSSYININDQVTRNGQDALFYLNDTAKTNPISRSSNNFTIDGITYSIKSASTEAVQFDVRSDTQGMFELITSFVKEYNDIVEFVDGKVKEKTYKDYPPLTEEQKSEMSEKQIEMWEEKAKSGLLRGDSILNNLSNNLRSAFFNSIQGVSKAFYNIGITVSRDVSNYKLEINEEKLRGEIANNPQEVMSLFNKQGDIRYSPVMTYSQRTQRYQESGFAQRISDIFLDNVRTTRDSTNNKGILIERAGITGDTSQYNNFLNQRINSVDGSIRKALEWLSTQEKSYWARFSAMEAALQRMNSQGQWLSSQLGGMNG